LRRSSDFTNHPGLLSSQRRDRVKRIRLRGDWHANDQLLLMTDALAHWFLRRLEEAKTPWRDLLSLHDQDQFAAWIDQLRDTHEIRNDDVTVMVIAMRR
jgi:hypothetical protein